jgi:hypothetical protein
VEEDIGVLDDDEGEGFEEGKIKVKGVDNGKKGVSQRTYGYTRKEDFLMCQS